MTKETLQKDLEKVLKSHKLLYTRLRTPNYGRRGVRYPADYVFWFPNCTMLIECKQRKKLPLAPSDIRQLPFMEEWSISDNTPRAFYGILTATEQGYCLFSYVQAVEAKQRHKGLTQSQALCSANTLYEFIEEILKWTN